MALTFVPDTETLVVITNVGEEPFIGWKMPAPVVTIPTGQSRRVPIEWARTWFGDERSRSDAYVIETSGDERISIPNREQELYRLQILWGASAYPNRWVKDSGEPYTRPECQVHTLEGERITTVLDDPEGTSVTPAPRSVDDDRLLTDELIALRRKIEVLESLQGNGAEVVPSLVREADLPRDETPSAAPAKARRG